MEKQRGTKIIKKIFAIISLDLILISIPFFYYYFKSHSVKNSFWELGIKKISKKNLAKNSIKVLAGLFALMFVISIASSLIQVNDLDKVNKTVKTIIETSPFLMLYYLVIRVFAEEIFFRGFLTKKIGVLSSSIIFGLAHSLYGSIIEIIGAFTAGLFLAHYFKKNNNLIPVILGHMGFNAIGLIMVF